MFFLPPRLLACELTEAVCGDLASALTSGAAQLREMDVRFNPIGDRGFVKLCKALQSPLCRLQELKYVLHPRRREPDRRRRV